MSSKLCSVLKPLRKHIIISLLCVILLMCISNFIIIAPLRDQFTIQPKANASKLEKNHDWLKTQDYN